MSLRMKALARLLRLPKFGGKRNAFIQTLHSDVPITIEQSSSHKFIYTSQYELPLGITFFLKDPEAIKNGVHKRSSFEILEIEQRGSLFYYEATFLKPKFDFNEWEKEHRRTV